MDTIKSKYHETLAATVIKNLEKRQMEGYYCPTVEDAQKPDNIQVCNRRRKTCIFILKRWADRIFRRLHDLRGDRHADSAPP